MPSLVSGSLSEQLNETVGAMLISKLCTVTIREVQCILTFCPFQARSSVPCAQVTLSPILQFLTFIRLQGVTTCQTIAYFLGSKTDSRVIRSLVIIRLTSSAVC